MNKEQFKKLKVGDVVEYNSAGILVGCQFKITKVINDGIVEGEVTKQGSGGNMIHSYLVGKPIAGAQENLTLVNAEPAVSESFATLALSVQEAAVLLRLMRGVSVCESSSLRALTKSIHTKLAGKFPSPGCLDDCAMFQYDKSIYSNISPRELDEKLIEIGLLKAPEKSKAAARHKLKGPDGKFAPKNYRRVMYPEHGTGKLIERHILLGDFVNGTSGTNVSVQEWDGKEWQPKTYSAAKIKPAN